MDSVLLGYARLARPANLPTAAADILAGVAIAGVISNFGQNDFLSASQILDIGYLVFASVFLYAGGVILNDVFDYKVDAIERPERPIPSGLIPLRSATIYGSTVLTIGVLLAFLVSGLSGIIAVSLALAILFYDGIAKKYDFLGPLSMGLCRGLNLVLGISVLGSLAYWWLAFIPVVYIFAITLISRGEVHANNKSNIALAGVLYASVISSIAVIAYFYTDSLLVTLIYLSLFAFLVFRPLIRAYTENSPKNIKKAVMAGVIALIVLDAAIAVTFSTWWFGLVILALLPASKGLAKGFAVT